MGYPLVFILLAGTIVSCHAFEDEPQHYSNESLFQSGIPSTRNLFGGLLGRATDNVNCQAGYAACLDGTTRCCPIGTSCCEYNGYCVYPGSTCCGTGTCSSNTKCCGGVGCAPIDSNCCNDGRYCYPGKFCRVWQGRNVCCPATGCNGEALSSTAVTALSTSGTSHTVSPTSNSSSASPSNAPLSVAAIAGIVIGIVAAAAIICVLLFRNRLGAILRRRGREQAPDSALPPSPPYAPPPGQGPMDPHVSELPDKNAVHELGQSEALLPVNDGRQAKEREDGSEIHPPVDKARGGSWKSTLYLGELPA